MKLKAKIEVEMEITDEFIINYAEFDSEFNKPEINSDSTSKEIQDYLCKNNKEIIEYAKETAIDWLAEKCDEVCLRGNYDMIEIEQIV